MPPFSRRMRGRSLGVEKGRSNGLPQPSDFCLSGVPSSEAAVSPACSFSLQTRSRNRHRLATRGGRMSHRMQR